MMDQKSIAVLPFTNLSASIEDQYFADGISEEIINTLSKIRGLKVTSRTSSFSYRHSEQDVRIIGNRLGVSTILEGSVRRNGDHVRISAQLVRTDTGFQIWSESFDRKMIDIFALQDEISRLIAEYIRENFGHLIIEDRLIDIRTGNSDAYNSYLLGRFYQQKWTQEGLQQALKAFKKSIALDADYPMPYLGIVQCFVFLATWNHTDRIKGLFMAHHFLSKLGPEHAHISEFHYTSGLFHFYGKWEFGKAEQCFLTALHLNPNSSDAMQALASLYNATGRFKKAHHYIDKAIALNPVSPNHNYTKAMVYYLNQEYREALEQINHHSVANSTWRVNEDVQAICLILLNKRDLFTRIVDEMDPQKAQIYRSLWQLYEKKEGQIAGLEKVHEENHLPINTYLLLYAGREEEGLNGLVREVQNKNGAYLNFANDPLLAPLYDQAEYKHLCQSVFPETELNTENNTPVQDRGAKYTTQELQPFVEALEQRVEVERLYISPELTLRQLAGEINLHPNKLSWLLNEHFEMNFNDYVNSFRLKEFQERALLPNAKNFTLLGLAFESGFSSKSTFNDYFKKKTGLTPRAWVKAQNG